jgi:hypothetical protein
VEGRNDVGLAEQRSSLNSFDYFSFEFNSVRAPRFRMLMHAAKTIFRQELLLLRPKRDDDDSCKQA